MSESQTRVEITVGGTVSCIDDEGGRSLAFEQFDALVDKIAPHLHSALGVSDPCVWGQASTGELEISCVLTVAGRASVDNPLDRFIRDVCDAGDLMLVDMITASTGNKSYWVARSGGRLSGTGLGRRSNAAAICSGVASLFCWRTGGSVLPCRDRWA